MHSNIKYISQHKGTRLTSLEKNLLNNYQRNFPMCAEPYAQITRELNNHHGLDVSEQQVMDTLDSLQQRGMISRIGAVLTPKKVGASTLAAMAVPEKQLEQVADLVSSYSQVNHNYAREHHFNLWFVVATDSEHEVQRVLDEIAVRTNLTVLDLPMIEDFHIDLGFPLWC